MIFGKIIITGLSDFKITFFCFREQFVLFPALMFKVMCRRQKVVSGAYK